MALTTEGLQRLVTSWEARLEAAHAEASEHADRHEVAQMFSCLGVADGFKEAIRDLKMASGMEG